MDDTSTEQDDSPTDDDKRADDDKQPDGADDGTRLDELGDKIQSVRAQAEDAVEGVAGEDDEKYTESGADESADEDDQTIAPPG